MKLVSLHIDNFGKFNNLDMSFNNGLNQLIEENGWYLCTRETEKIT